MIDRETAIKILRQVDCPVYSPDGWMIPTEEVDEAFAMAINALKAQEPRVLTLEEATGDDECWFEHASGACGYADCYLCTGAQAVEVWRTSIQHPEYLTWGTYGKKWRCWSSKPTDEQRSGMPWE